MLLFHFARKECAIYEEDNVILLYVCYLYVVTKMLGITLFANSHIQSFVAWRALSNVVLVICKPVREQSWVRSQNLSAQ
jgi:hypothetical protein